MAIQCDKCGSDMERTGAVKHCGGSLRQKANQYNDD